MDDKEVRRVVTEYSSMIKRVSYNYLKQPFDCDDICQTVFLKLLTADVAFENHEHEKDNNSNRSVFACALGNRLADRSNQQRRTALAVEQQG